MAEKKFELTNLATGKKSLAEVKSGTLGPDVLSIGSLAKDHGMFTFDPGFMATASCESKITFIDGDERRVAVSGLPDRAAGREEQLPGSRLPADQRRTADHRAAKPSSRTRSSTTR